MTCCHARSSDRRATAARTVLRPRAIALARRNLNSVLVVFVRGDVRLAEFNRRGRAQGVEAEIREVLHVVRRALERELHRPRGFVVHASRNLTDAHAPRGGAEDEPARAVDVMKAREGHDATRLATHRQRQHARSPRHQPQWFRPRDEHASNAAAIAHPFESRQSTSRQRVLANRPVPSPSSSIGTRANRSCGGAACGTPPRRSGTETRIHQHRAVSSKRGEKRPLVRHREGVHAKLDDIRRGGRVRG